MRYLFDIETNAIDFSIGNHAEQVTDCWCIVLLDIDTGNMEWGYGEEGVARMLKKLEEADELIGHNIIQFDIPALEKLFGFKTHARITDTLVYSRLLYPDRPGGHSLRAWGERLGEDKGEFTDFSQYSEEMLKYCQQDIRTNHVVYRHLLAEMSDYDWTEALALEHQIAQIIVNQEKAGIAFDKDKAEEHLDVWNTRLAELDTDVVRISGLNCVSTGTVAKPFKINGDLTKRATDLATSSLIDLDSIGGPFSCFQYTPPKLGSKDVQKTLLLEAGWKPKKFTPTGKPELTADIKDIEPLGPMFVERNSLTRAIGVLDGFLSVVDSKQRIHAGANPCGTNTCRMRHTRVVNVPSNSAPFGKEFRSLFTVHPHEERYLIGYDAKQCQIRGMAHYVGNQLYIERLEAGEDAHRIATDAAGLGMSDEVRPLGKTINYGLIFGARDKKLGEIVGGNAKDGRDLRRKLYSSIPGLQQFIARTEAAAKKGYMVGLDGRKLWLRSGKSPINTLVQGAEAIFMKTSAVILDELARELKAFKVLDMHDEAQWDCLKEDSEELSSLIHVAFAQANARLGLRCKQEADVNIGYNWSETH